MRVEIRLAVVVSLRPKGAAFGQAGSTRLDSTRLLGCNFGSKLKLAFGKLFGPWWNREKLQSHTDFMIHSSHRLRPIFATHSARAKNDCCMSHENMGRKLRL